MDLEAVAKRLGLAVKVRRVVVELSQKELAESARELGGPPLTQAAVSAIESGDRMMRVDELIAIAQALSNDPRDLLAVAIEPSSIKELVITTQEEEE